MKSNKKIYCPKSTRKAHVEIWITSGLSKAEYSREHGLTDKNFRHWVKEQMTLAVSIILGAYLLFE